MVLQDAEVCVINYELYMKSLVTKNTTNGVVLNVKLYTVG
jgi:hypothetical protein